MPTVNAGASATFSIPAGQTAMFNADGNGTAVLSGGQMDGTPYSIGETVVTIGPFNNAQNVSVSCDRAVTYTLIPGGMRAPRLDASTSTLYDTNGNVVTVGSGSTSVQGRRAVLMGDSLKALEFCLPTADTPIYGSPFSVPQSQFNPRGVFNWLNAFCGQPWTLVGARGVSGENSIQILARWPDVVADNPDDVFMDAGRNDVTQLTTTYGGDAALCFNTTVANVTSMWDQAAKKGIRIFYESISPKQVSSGEGTPENTLVVRINTELKRQAALRKNVVFIDTFSALINPAIVQGYAIATLYVDTTHWATNGAVRQALLFVAMVSKYVTPNPTLVSSQNDCFQKNTLSTNVLAAIEGLIQGTQDAAVATGTAGTKLASMTVSRVAGSGTATYSIGAAPVVPAPIGDGITSIGNSLRQVVASAVAGEIHQVSLPVTSGPSFAQLGAGSFLQGECLVQVSSASGLISVACEVVIAYTGGSPAGPTRSRTMYPVSLAFDGTDTLNYTAQLKTPPVQIPANATGLTSIAINWYTLFSKAGGATVDISRASIRKVTA